MFRPIAAVLLAIAVPALAAAPNAPKTSEGERASDAADKVICKRFPEIGSLVSTYRVCKTKREWENGRSNGAAMNAINSCEANGERLGC